MYAHAYRAYSIPKVRTIIQINARLEFTRKHNAYYITGTTYVYRLLALTGTSLIAKNQPGLRTFRSTGELSWQLFSVGYRLAALKASQVAVRFWRFRSRSALRRRVDIVCYLSRSRNCAGLLILASQSSRPIAEFRIDQLHTYTYSRAKEFHWRDVTSGYSFAAATVLQSMANCKISR